MRIKTLYYLLILVIGFGILQTECFGYDSLWWDTKIKKSNGETRNIFNSSVGNDKEELAWQGHYWLRAYETMARATGEDKYVEAAIELIDHIFEYRDDKRAKRGELNIIEQPYNTSPPFFIKNRNKVAPCWRRIDSKGEIHTLVVDDGQITSAIMRFVDLVFTNNEFSKYIPIAKKYIEFVENTVKAHDESFIFNKTKMVPGSYYWNSPKGELYSNPVHFNMNASMGVTLILIDKYAKSDGSYRKKAEAILDYFKLNVIYKKENDSYIWTYHFDKDGKNTGPFEDITHGHMDISFLNMAYKNGFNISKKEMKKLANTLKYNIYLGNGELASFVDGTVKFIDYGPGGNEVGFDWIDLDAFDPAVFEIAKSVYKKHYLEPTWSRQFLGWANIILRMKNKNK